MTKQNARITMLKEEKVWKALLKLGIPTMLGMLVSALYNAVDAYFVGGLGKSQMGAVSVVFPVVQIIIGLGMTFGAGASSYISRLLGQGGQEQASRTASTALFSSVVTGGAVIIGILIFLDPVLRALGATETILPYARAYAQIYIGGAIINVFTVTMNNIVTAEGAAGYTMAAMLTGSILNIILDPIFIYKLNMGIRGAAIATVISLFANLMFYVAYILMKKSCLRFSWRQITFTKEIYIQILKIGVPVLLFQLITSAAMSLTNTAAKPYGDYAVAAMGTVSRVITVGVYIVFGFMKGFQPFAGFNYGAKQYGRLKKAVFLCAVGSTIFCALTAVVLCVFARPVVSLFGSDPDMVQLAAWALRANAVLFVTFGFQMVYASLYLSIGEGVAGSILSLGRQGIFFIPLVLLLPHLFGMAGIVSIQPIADGVATVVTIFFAIRFYKKLKFSKEHTQKIENKAC